MMMAAAACGSLWFTPRRVHEENHFNYAPIREIAFLFFGIFMTMLPALNFSRTRTKQSRCARRDSITSPAERSRRCSTTREPDVSAVREDDPLEQRQTAGRDLDGRRAVRRATYIGNGPNFMVKSIAEHADVPTPSFFGYLFKFTIPILLPILILVWWIFLRSKTAH